MAEGGQPTEGKGLRDFMNVCHLCGDLENLSLCGGCKDTWYCSKDHQRQDWKEHKRDCKKSKKSSSAKTKSKKSSSSVTASEEPADSLRENMPTEVTDDCTNQDVDSIYNSNYDSNEFELGLPQSERTRCLIKCLHLHSMEPDNYSDNNGKQKPLSTLATESITKESCDCNKGKVTEKKLDLHLVEKSTNHSKSLKKKRQGQEHLPSISEDGLSLGRERYYLDRSTHKLDLPTSLKVAVSKQTQSVQQGDELLSPSQCREQYLSVLNHRFEILAKYVVNCLTTHGICVIDNFLGEITGREILKEVKQFETAGVMKQGQLVQGTSSSSTNKYIRGDIITWVDGADSNSENIHYLISCMDAVMIQSAGHLQPYTINERTKAMVACYPGRKTRYVRHVDNPNGDGRCVTCIYYLNENWDVKKYGGLLRIYPEGEDRVANIEPKFDRLLFFWSDRRNPHEVEESFKERYAITVWYYDADERAQALKKSKVTLNE